jgi:hypothetical protein
VTKPLQAANASVLARFCVGALTVPVARRRWPILRNELQKLTPVRDIEIGNNMRIQEHQMSFFIHLWLEDGEHPLWRGRVNDGDGGHSIAFENEEVLLEFIRSRLLKESVVLPRRPADYGGCAA